METFVMSDPDARALLVEALEFFNDHPRFSLRRDRRRDSYALASRIEAFLARDEMIPPVLATAPERYARALRALPEMTCKILLAHQRDEQDFGTIAAQLGITTREVEQHIADALLAISRALDQP
ncbi:hypothetical protein [Sphingobium fuliginis]|jgi:DNA-directed RNA polymerase specialized sigma24 family protein|nr:hypothetical protein [Sphingobium fuliginis]EQB16519.1 hypothetical protein RLDS_06805 [Sphingobium lactosutens DS20]